MYQLSRYVLGNDLFLCGKHVYNHYRDCKDIGSYLCGDCIVDVIAYQSQKVRICKCAWECMPKNTIGEKINFEYRT